MYDYVTEKGGEHRINVISPTFTYQIAQFDQ